MRVLHPRPWTLEWSSNLLLHLHDVAHGPALQCKRDKSSPCIEPPPVTHCMTGVMAAIWHQLATWSAGRGNNDAMRREAGQLEELNAELKMKCQQQQDSITDLSQ